MTQQLVLELAPPPVPSLDNFYAGPNQAALAALGDALAGGERMIYLVGDTGSGKTHLLRAAVREAEALGHTAIYVGAPHADLRTSPPCDVLAVDDLESLDSDAQLALFDIFNSLRAGLGRLFGASTLSAAELPVREDLRTRLGSGLSLRLAPLNDEEKAAALVWHASQRGLRLPPEIIDYVLTHCGRDMGTQIAVLDALDRYSLEHKRAITLPLLREALGRLKLKH